MQLQLEGIYVQRTFDAKHLQVGYVLCTRNARSALNFP